VGFGDDEHVRGGPIIVVVGTRWWSESVEEPGIVDEV
jgi:hypothetical protein